MIKILHKIILYERFNRLTTDESKKIFLHTVYTLSISVIAIIFIWYCGISFLSSNYQKTNNHPLDKYADNNPQKVTLYAEKADIQKPAPSLKPYQTTTGNALKSDTKNNTSSQAAVALNTKTDETINKSDNTQKQNVKYNFVPVASLKSGAVKKPIYSGPRTSNVALTFDDGYNKKLVEKTLDVLKKHNIKVTFFIIGEVLYQYPDVWKRAAAEGHQICNHTMSHEMLTNLSNEQIKKQIMGWEYSVKKVLGVEYYNRMKKEFPFIRFPGGAGSKSNRVLRVAQNCGYTVIGWNLETYSRVISPMRKTSSVTQIAVKIKHHVVSGCSKGSIILMHFNSYDITNIDEIVSGITKKGYKILTVSELLQNQ